MFVFWFSMNIKKHTFKRIQIYSTKTYWSLYPSGVSLFERGIDRRRYSWVLSHPIICQKTTEMVPMWRVLWFEQTAHKMLEVSTPMFQFNIFLNVEKIVDRQQRNERVFGVARENKLPYSYTSTPFLPWSTN